MTGDSRQFWDDVWQAGSQESPHLAPDPLLVEMFENHKPGRVLDVGCGDGSNGVWLAERGWRVTALDFSRNAIQAGRRSAEAAGVDVEFIVADASTYRPQGAFDLITSFYIQLPPSERRALLRNMPAALKPGGILLFVSHDRSTPPQGWSDADLSTLTNVEEVIAEIRGMTIERAEVVKHCEPHANDSHSHDNHDGWSNSTVVVARAKGRG